MAVAIPVMARHMPRAKRLHLRSAAQPQRMLTNITPMNTDPPVRITHEKFSCHFSCCAHFEFHGLERFVLAKKYSHIFKEAFIYLYFFYNCHNLRSHPVEASLRHNSRAMSGIR